MTMRLNLTFPQGLQTPCVLALGMFDGVHIGHRELLLTARAISRKEGLPLRVMSFQTHPMSILAPRKAPPLLTTLAERAGAMAQLGADEMYALPFTMDIANESPLSFLSCISRTLRPRHIVAGFNYTFGKGGQGNDGLLEDQSLNWGYTAHIVPPVSYQGEPVSATRIRTAIAGGQMTLANHMLGRPYAITGQVEHGKRMGHHLGYPTANLALPKSKIIPAFGVYTALLETNDASYPAVVNVGHHPTLPLGHGTIEAHVLGSGPMLYGQKARIRFLRYQREEKRFDSVTALQTQIKVDVQAACRYFDISAKKA